MSTPHTPETPSPYGTPGQPDPSAAPAQPVTGQPTAGSRYGTTPYEAGPYGAAAPAGTPSAFGADLPEPPQHRRLLKLTLASAGTYVLSSVLGMFVDTEAVMRRQLEMAGMSGTEIDSSLEQARAFEVFGDLGGIASLLLAVALYALVYFGLRAVKNWARVTGIVLAIISTLFSLFGLLGVAVMFAVGDIPGILAGLLTLVFVVINIVWLVTAFQRDEAAYTKQGRRVAA